MVNILDRYGIKEVADVQFFTIKDGKPDKLVLYLDTLKVSTIEQTADNVEAKGGKGNPALVSWDYNKDINVTLEDALFSAKSMAILFGDGTVYSSDDDIIHTFRISKGNSLSNYVDNGKVTYNGAIFTISGTPSYYDARTGEQDTTLTTTASTVTSATKAYLVTCKLQASETAVITIDGNSFPDTYYVIGDTFARPDSGENDEFFQFVIPKAKITSENTITMEADGDPSVFNLNLRVLRPADGKMMKLVRYTGTKATTATQNQVSIY